MKEINTHDPNNIFDIPHNCPFCDFRHNCCQDYEVFRQSFVDDEPCCESFRLGKCFYCAMHQDGFDELCRGYGDIYYPQGCINFKPGLYYDHYLAYEGDFDIPGIPPSMIGYNTHKASRKNRKKRYDDQQKKKRLINIAKNAKFHPGPYYDEDTGRVGIWERGSRSKYLKKLAHKKARRSDKETLYNKGNYHRLFDYWWELF